MSKDDAKTSDADAWRCQGATRWGARCLKPAPEGSKYCAKHKPKG